MRRNVRETPGLEQPELAKASYLAALDREPAHVGSLMNLASLAVEAGERAQARGLLSRLLEVDAARRALSSDERQRIERWLGEQADGAAQAEGAASPGG